MLSISQASESLRISLDIPYAELCISKQNAQKKRLHLREIHACLLLISYVNKKPIRAYIHLKMFVPKISSQTDFVKTLTAGRK